MPTKNWMRTSYLLDMKMMAFGARIRASPDRSRANEMNLWAMTGKTNVAAGSEDSAKLRKTGDSAVTLFMNK